MKALVLDELDVGGPEGFPINDSDRHLKGTLL